MAMTAKIVYECISAKINEVALQFPDVDIDEQDEDGMTALMYAVRRSDVATAIFLLEHRADPNLENNEGHTALMIAIDWGCYSLGHLLAYYSEINYENKFGNNAIDYDLYHESGLTEVLELYGAVPTGKPTPMEVLDEEMWLLEAQNYANFDAIFPTNSAHPFLKKLEVLQPPHKCDKYSCTTCGGILASIKRNMTPTLKQEILAFIDNHTNEDLILHNTSKEQLLNLISLYEKD
jgi:hypothetical protein